jgi:hypothetical protein
MICPGYKNWANDVPYNSLDPNPQRQLEVCANLRHDVFIPVASYATYQIRHSRG